MQIALVGTSTRRCSDSIDRSGQELDPARSQHQGQLLKTSQPVAGSGCDCFVETYQSRVPLLSLLRLSCRSRWTGEADITSFCELSGKPPQILERPRDERVAHDGIAIDRKRLRSRSVLESV